MKPLWNPNTNLPTESFYNELNSEDYNQDEVLRLCKEYFEIAIGIRKPTEDEKSASSRILIQSIIPNGDEIDDLDRIRVAKYPPDFSKELRYQALAIIEYTVFKKLAHDTNNVDGPYIPMLRAELYHQLKDFENENLEPTLFRQSAFFETYCRMKLGKSRKTQWKHLEVSSVDIFDSNDENILSDIRDVRDDFAHDWRVYINRNRQQNELREACVQGLGLLSKLHKKELIKTYRENCNNHIAERYASEWVDRASGKFESSASATLRITCDRCETQFVPEKEGLKRCPNCDKPHDYLDKYE